MQNYMISKRFERYGGATQRPPRRFLGVASPERRTHVRAGLAQHPLTTSEDWRTAVAELWRAQKFREEGYASIDLVRGPARHRRFYDAAFFAQLDEMVITGAWWDYVDPLSSAFGTLLLRFPEEIRPRLLRYAVDDDIWRRRSAILSQLKAKDATDFDLLVQCMEPSIESGEFFLDKAIGWALRTYARTRPDRVRRYVRRHEERLAPLARREALKHLEP